jgi:hypothetical protein
MNEPEEKKLEKHDLLEKDIDQKEFDFGDSNLLTVYDKKNRNQLFAPKVILASSLFTSKNRNQEREFIKEKPLYVIEGLGAMSYRGEELRSYDDKKIWQVLLKAAQEQKIHLSGFLLQTSCWFILNQLSWGESKKDYDRLKESLARLKGAGLTVTNSTGTTIRSASLIGDYDILNANNSKKAKLVVPISPKIYQLFHREDVILLQQNITSKLSVLGDKVLDVILSTNGRPILVEEYMKVTGSNYKLLRQFKARLKKSMEELQSHDLIKHFEISEQGLVSIVLAEEKLTSH